MPFVTRQTASAAALLALAQPQIALAQQCVEQQDLTDTAIYAVPLLAQSFEQRCAAELDPDGWFVNESDGLVSKFAGQQAERWPGALRLLSVFVSKGKAGDQEMASLFSELPPEALRPFVDAIVIQKAAEAFKPKDCRKIERGLALVAPLPAENLGGLVTFLMDMAGVDDPKLCPLEE